MDLAELLGMPGIREECILRSNVGFMALLGGSQARGTEQIAGRAAEEAGASSTPSSSLPGCGSTYLTVARSRPLAESRAFLEHVNVAISVHGFGRDGFALWLDPEGGVVIEPYGPAMWGK